MIDSPGTTWLRIFTIHPVAVDAAIYRYYDDHEWRKIGLRGRQLEMSKIILIQGWDNECSPQY